MRRRRSFSLCKSVAGPKVKRWYMMMDCVKDARYNHGNKIGGNKYHNISNVPIVHFSHLCPSKIAKCDGPAAIKREDVRVSQFIRHRLLCNSSV